MADQLKRGTQPKELKEPANGELAVMRLLSHTSVTEAQYYTFVFKFAADIGEKMVEEYLSKAKRAGRILPEMEDP